MEEIDRDNLMKQTKAQIIEEMVVAIDAQAQEREAVFRQQADSINRVMRGVTDLEEIARLQARIVELEKRLDMALEENRRLRGQPTSAMNIGLKLGRPNGA